MADDDRHFAATDEHASAPATRTMAIDPGEGGQDAVPEGATLFVGTGGDVCIQAMRDPAGTKTVFKNVANGSFLPVRVREVFGSEVGTTASDLVLVW